VTFFGDKMMMTSQKWHHNWFYEVQFLQNQHKIPQFGQITKLQAIKIEGLWGWGRRASSAWRFL